jgi:outer membrane protein assembly factor BamB
VRPPRLTRRRLLAAGGLSLAAGLALDPSLVVADDAASEPVADWPMPRRDPARTGFDPDGAAPRGDFSVAWEAPVPDAASRTRPLAVADGTVYAVGRDAVVARDAATGTLRWRFDGRKRPWRAPLQFSSPPLASDGGLLVAAETAVLGFGAASGRLRWSYDGTTNVGTPLLAAGSVYCPDATDGTAVLDATTGLPRDRSPLRTELDPLAFRGGLLVGRGGAPDELAAVDARTGRREWRLPLGVADPSSLSPCVGRDAVYYGSGPLYAVSIDDGGVLWEGDVGARRAALRPVTDGDRVFVAAGDDAPSFAAALDASTGDRLWRTDVPVPRDGLAAVVGETVYLPTNDGFVALDATDGTEVGRFEARADDGDVRSPAVADGTVYVGVGGTLYAAEGSA